MMDGYRDMANPFRERLSERARTQRRDQKTGRFVAQRRSSQFADGFVLGAWSGLILGMGVFAALRVVCG
jgi:hypothetical protein